MIKMITLNEENKIADIIVKEAKKILRTKKFGGFICNKIERALFDSIGFTGGYDVIRRILEFYCKTQKIQDYTFGPAGEWTPLREHFC